MENNLSIKGQTVVNGVTFYYEISPVKELREILGRNNNNFYFTDNNGHEAAVFLTKGGSPEEKIKKVWDLRKWNLGT